MRENIHAGKYGDKMMVRTKASTSALRQLCGVLGALLQLGEYKPPNMYKISERQKTKWDQQEMISQTIENMSQGGWRLENIIARG